MILQYKNEIKIKEEKKKEEKKKKEVALLVSSSQYNYFKSQSFIVLSSL